MSRVLIVMGVAGSGKSTIGRLIAERLGWKFSDADDFHPPANILKLKSGQPLDDDDRLPWLSQLRESIDEHLAAGENLVLACSALKARYREILGAGDPRVDFLFLAGDRELITARIAARAGHFMSPALLESQFNALEVPVDAVVVGIDQPIPDIVAEAMERLRSEFEGQ